MRLNGKVEYSMIQITGFIWSTFTTANQKGRLQSENSYQDLRKY